MEVQEATGGGMLDKGLAMRAVDARHAGEGYVNKKSPA